MKKIEVVAAVIINNLGQIFCAQRKNSGELALKWEFPGGKIENNESYREALFREIKEELEIEIEINDYIMTTKYAYNTFDLTMHVFFSKINNGKIFLNEHINSLWLYPNELTSLDWASADVPIVNYLVSKNYAK